MIYSILREAVGELKPDDKRRVYRVNAPGSTRFVIAASPAAAALAVIGEEHVELVSQRERYNAALEALMQKVPAK